MDETPPYTEVVEALAEQLEETIKCFKEAVSDKRIDEALHDIRKIVKVVNPTGGEGLFVAEPPCGSEFDQDKLKALKYIQHEATRTNT